MPCLLSELDEERVCALCRALQSLERTMHLKGRLKAERVPNIELSVPPSDRD